MLDRLLDLSPNFGLDTLLLLPVLIALEAVLSADNAIALATIAQGLQVKELERKALNVGLVVAFLLRVVLILTATWVLKYWQFEVLGAVYLLWLVFQYFTSDENGNNHHHHGPRFTSVWQAVPMIALTDLAFSLDSVTTAIALSQEIWLVLLGGLIGVITLRFMAGLFIRWLDIYTHLEDAGFLTVALVGLRLLVRVINPDWVPPEWIMISAIMLLFAWGFSKRNPDPSGDALPDQPDEGKVATADPTPAFNHAATAAKHGIVESQLSDPQGTHRLSEDSPPDDHAQDLHKDLHHDFHKDIHLDDLEGVGKQPRLPEKI